MAVSEYPLPEAFGTDPYGSSSVMSPAEVTEKLGLHRMKDRSWYVHPR
jgi:hypothetical protein